MKWTILLLLVIFSCQNISEPDSGKSQDENNSEKSKATLSKAEIPTLSEMTIAVDNLRLREKPGSEGKEIMRLPERSVVIPTGQKTELKQKVSLRGISYNEPWIEVQVNESTSGWVFGGAIDLNPNSSQFAAELFDDRLDYFFGKMAGSVKSYIRQMELVSTALDLKQAWSGGRAIIADAEKQFLRRCRLSEMPADINLSWIEKAMPGFSLVKIAEGFEIAVLPNLDDLLKRASKTPESDDDQAFSFIKELNGGYGIQSIFRNWNRAAADFQTVSLLGSGNHFKGLKLADDLAKEENIFSEGIIKEECNLIVEDIVKNENGYENGRSVIIAEIDQIIAADFDILSADQKMAIAERKKTISVADKK